MKIRHTFSVKEEKGIKMLSERVRKGEICVVSSDKSKRFVVLTQDQYRQSGLQHTTNDSKVKPDEIRRFQRVLNSHNKWFKGMFQMSAAWGQEERMSKNMTEGGEQTCPMTCLIKDHK